MSGIRQTSVFAVGDRLEEPRGTNLGEGVVIDTCDIDPPSSTRPFIVKFGGCVYGMNNHGALYDTLTGKNLATVTRRLRIYREFWLVTQMGKSVTTTITASLFAPRDKAGVVVARMRWYEDGEVVQAGAGTGTETITDQLRRDIQVERDARQRLFTQLGEKDRAMGVLMERMRNAGVDFSDLIS